MLRRYLAAANPEKRNQVIQKTTIRVLQCPNTQKFDSLSYIVGVLL
jgi:hypothetical protein